MEAEKAPKKKSLRADAKNDTLTEVQALFSFSSRTMSPVPVEGPGPPQMAKSIPLLAETAKLEAAD